jgi:hypothetical protein
MSYIFEAIWTGDVVVQKEIFVRFFPVPLIVFYFPVTVVQLLLQLQKKTTENWRNVRVFVLN